ncbi:glutathione binding-like protein (plasmid) [Cupriavidus sp. Agwp_2]
MLSLRYESVTVDAMDPCPVPTTPFVPFEKQPLIEDEALRLHNAEAILTYLARKYDRFGTWLPDDARATGLIAQWLSFASGELTRLGNSTSRSEEAALHFLNEHLTNRKWLELDRPTIADVSCYPSVAHAQAAGFDLTPVPFVLEWLERFRSMPGFVTDCTSGSRVS